MHNNQKTLYSKIVGTNFKDPIVRSLLGVLKHGHTLILKREPDNKFDSNAIAIWVMVTGEMRDALSKGEGVTLPDEGTEIHMGYIPRIDNVFLKDSETVIVSCLKSAANKTSCTVFYLPKEAKQP